MKRLYAFNGGGVWIIVRQPVGTLYDAIGPAWVGTSHSAEPPTEWDGVEVVVLGNERRHAA